ncbi:uncharacterized protein BXZ73DRAFT_88651 [Epithele typhae]|uniref:uncharacterized protein n=1 Tax=Epithele typhae TaxID=378194 RepID=UPI002008330B|nr:uncharacterized protein BXZ73DRAFT_88651 [Epithele typhae]KAH9940393.1 hypothetical protein BXZ73DRAFT_88651 [Epithele typhae]
MESDTLPPTPKSPSVGMRRKGPKPFPTLPLSAFTPPNTGISDQFPRAPSPSAMQPFEIVDAHVLAPTGDLAGWTAQAGQTLGGRTRGVVVSLQATAPTDVEKIITELSSDSSSTPVVAIAVPFKLEDGVPATTPSYLASGSSSTPAIVLTTTFTETSSEAIAALEWALKQKFTVNIDVQSGLEEENGWEAIEDFLTKATADAEAKGKIILSNIVPPPDDLTLPIVKLLTHPTYRNYQSRTASLSLFANLFINFLPPAWGAPTPPTPAPPPPESQEWRRRIKMYLGPTVEAFGFQRILFGTSPAAPLTGMSQASKAGDWYELARECFVELGVEQDAIDAVFAGNARLVYGPPAAQS